MLDSLDTVETIVDPKDAAESAGLRYVSDVRPGIRRKKAGAGFTYTHIDGSRLSEKDVLKRIRGARDSASLDRCMDMSLC